MEASTIGRWALRYAPLLEQEIRWSQGYTGGSWRVDETGVRVTGEWKWLFRAVDEAGRTIDFLLRHRRNAKAAWRFLAKAIGARRDRPPHAVNTDKHPAYGEAIRDMKRSGALPPEFEHRRAKFLNDRLEADHRPIERLCRTTLGFKGMRTVSATITGFEAVRMIRKQQCVRLEPGVAGELRLVAKLFRIPA